MARTIILILLFFFQIDFVHAKEICLSFYRKTLIELPNFNNQKIPRYSLRSKIVFEGNSRVSNELQIKVPSNFKGDLQIEIIGHSDTKYLISSLKAFNLDQEIIFVGPTKKKNSNYIDKNLLSQIEPFPGEADVVAFNSPLRSIPGYGFTSILIPNRLFKKSKSDLVLKIKIEKDKQSELQTSARVILQARKVLGKYDFSKVNLNLFFPSDLNSVYSSEVVDQLIARLNSIYEIAGIKFQIKNRIEVSNIFKEIDIDKTPESLAPSSTSNLPGIPILFTSRLGSSSVGNIGGFSQGIPGPSSIEGSRKFRVYQYLSPLPSESDKNARDSWFIETSNYLAHEIGHYLGLYHTYERLNNKLQDPFSDTPNQDSYNVMDPLINRIGIPNFSIKQIGQIRSHPLVEIKQE